MKLLHPLHFKDYELLDCGGFEKLERFGSFFTVRPEPQAVWNKNWSAEQWQKMAHVRFVPKNSSSGSWQKFKSMPDQWNIEYTIANSKPSQTIQFRLGLTAFKHVGVFPEQASNWERIYQFAQNIPNCNMLNLFAYTGGASLAGRLAGAEVTHVDSIRQVLNWAHENQKLSNISNIRWMLEDALSFVKKEIRRKKTYSIIVLDPPSYGHGPNGEKWKLEDHIAEMMHYVLQLLNPKQHLLILNAYSLGLSALITHNLLYPYAKLHSSAFDCGELWVPSTSGLQLPLGVWGSLEKL